MMGMRSDPICDNLQFFFVAIENIAILQRVTMGGIMKKINLFQSSNVLSTTTRKTRLQFQFLNAQVLSISPRRQ
jgi:hypothetical protein